MPTAVDEAALAAGAAYWVDQSAAASGAITTNATAAAAGAWGSYAAWYDAAQAAQQAKEMAGLSLHAQEAVAGLFTEYIAQTTALLRQESRVEVPTIAPPSVRNGADPVVVHTRPATVFKETFAFTGDERLAQQRAVERAVQLMETDIMLAARQAQQDAMTKLKVAGYRRVLRPELSKTGTCALCIVASNRIYRTSELMPIHGRCKCETMPIVNGVDPGQSINSKDLKRLYAAAGDTTDGRELKRVRIQINEHGELGPVLSVRGHNFTARDDLVKRDPADQLKQLQQLEGVLKDLMARPNKTGQLDAPLAYQRARIGNLKRITAA